MGAQMAQFAQMAQMAQMGQMSQMGMGQSKGKPPANLCMKWVAGTCTKGDACNFAHGQETGTPDMMGANFMAMMGAAYGAGGMGGITPEQALMAGIDPAVLM